MGVHIGAIRKSIVAMMLVILSSLVACKDSCGSFSVVNTGRVTDGGNLPIEGVAIYTASPDGNESSLQATTDADGIYRFSRGRRAPLDGGFIIFRKPGYVEKTLELRSSGLGCSDDTVVIDAVLTP